MTSFNQLGLPAALLRSLNELGYERPTPVQEQSIPVLLDGEPLLAQAQTGTGKTAAFALPALSHIDVSIIQPQTLILTPTRELAIQVSEALVAYAKHMPAIRVLPIYGGAAFAPQLKALKRGVHIIVGTPGRVMDHMRRGKLNCEQVNCLVLDEADEMLTMGFQEDVEWILEQLPNQPQIAMFSATMPSAIRKIARQYMPNASLVKIKNKTETVASIEQVATVVSKTHKLEALTRFLEAWSFDAAIVFTRTKVASAELAEKLQARGHRVAAINGDLSQDLREKIIGRLKNKALDILVATDVAARGLDVPRISLVINYDIPHDPETYVHRIGRTGRAGREGRALLLLEPREKRLLGSIERMTKQPVNVIKPPSKDDLASSRFAKLGSDIIALLKEKDLSHYREVVCTLAHDCETSELDIAAALAYLSHKVHPTKSGKSDPLLAEEPIRKPKKFKKKFKGRKSGSTEKKRSFKRRERSHA